MCVPASRSRIVLGKPTAEWDEEVLSATGLALEPLSPMIAIESCQLPAGFRSDPADHLIVATARMTGATLMTRDRRILGYAAAGHLMAARAWPSVSAAGWLSPSGTHRSRGRIAGLRGSPRRPATGRA